MLTLSVLVTLAYAAPLLGGNHQILQAFKRNPEIEAPSPAEGVASTVATLALPGQEMQPTHEPTVQSHAEHEADVEDVLAQLSGIYLNSKKSRNPQSISDGTGIDDHVPDLVHSEGPVPETLAEQDPISNITGLVNDINLDSEVVNVPSLDRTEMVQKETDANGDKNLNQVKVYRPMRNNGGKNLNQVKVYRPIRNLTTVGQVWDEYSNGLNGNPSIMSLERQYGPLWRNSPAIARLFASRKPLYNWISSRIIAGYTEDEAVNQLESLRNEQNWSLNDLGQYLLASIKGKSSKLTK